MQSEAATRAAALLRASSVPVQVTLHAGDVTSKQQPLPCFFSVPRSSVLAALWLPLSEAFKDSIADFGVLPPLWLLTEEDEKRWAAGEKIQPVPWHVPVGALVDSLCSRLATRPLDPATANTSFINLALPLRLVAHMAPPPPKTVVWRLHRSKECEILAQQCLKQGLMARFGGLRAFYKAAPEHIGAFVSGCLATSVGSVASHETFRSGTEAILKVGRSVCVHEGETPKLPVTVHRGGRRLTTTVDTPVSTSAQAAIKAEEEAGAPTPSLGGAPSPNPAAEDEVNGPNTPAERPTSNANGDGMEPETPLHMQHGGTPDQPYSPPGPVAAAADADGRKETAPALETKGVLEDRAEREVTPETCDVHSDDLLIARAIAAALTPQELAEAGCNLPADVDTPPPAEPFCHPRLMVLVGGLRPLLTTPLAWAMQHLVYADLALHVVVLETSPAA